MSAAEHIFRLSKPGEDGVPLRDKLEHVRQTTGKHIPELDGPDIPSPLAHVWGWFCELDQARTGNGFGANPITFSELQAWSMLTGNHPRPHEIRLLQKLDRIRLYSLQGK